MEQKHDIFDGKLTNGVLDSSIDFTLLRDFLLYELIFEEDQHFNIEA